MRTDEFHSLLDFWFGDIIEGFSRPELNKLWFAGSGEGDELIRKKFATLHQQAANGELTRWQAEERGNVALVILLDQFSRNLYRGSAEAFAYDAQALSIAKDCVARGIDLRLSFIERVFLYMPYEHSESMADQEECCVLFEALLADGPESHRDQLQGFLDFAYQHRDIIARFGRYPHRNALLGRKSRQEELRFLQQGGSTFGQK